MVVYICQGISSARWYRRCPARKTTAAAVNLHNHQMLCRLGIAEDFMNAIHTVRGASWGKFKGRFHQFDCGHDYNVPEPFRIRHTVAIKGIH